MKFIFLDVYLNWLFENDVFLWPIQMLSIAVYRTFVWTNQTKINFMLILSHVLIYSSIKSSVNENICLRREWNQRPLAFQLAALTTINTCGNACMKLIFVRCVLELTVWKNMYFFYQYRCYLFLFTELCMNKPNHNRFHTYIVTRVDL